MLSAGEWLATLPLLRASWTVSLCECGRSTAASSAALLSLSLPSSLETAETAPLSLPPVRASLASPASRIESTTSVLETLSSATLPLLSASVSSVFGIAVVSLVRRLCVDLPVGVVRLPWPDLLLVIPCFLHKPAMRSTAAIRRCPAAAHKEHLSRHCHASLPRRRG